MSIKSIATNAGLFSAASVIIAGARYCMADTDEQRKVAVSGGIGGVVGSVIGAVVGDYLGKYVDSLTKNV